MWSMILAIIEGLLTASSKIADLFRARAEKAQRDEAKADGAATESSIITIFRGTP